MSLSRISSFDYTRREKEKGTDFNCVVKGITRFSESVYSTLYTFNHAIQFALERLANEFFIEPVCLCFSWSVFSAIYMTTNKSNVVSCQISQIGESDAKCRTDVQTEKANYPH